MNIRRHFIVSICFLLIFLISGCSSNEPDNQLVQQNFQQNTNGYNEALKMFKEDIAKTNISFVSSEDPIRTQCGQKPKRHRCHLRIERWKEYKHSLQRLGVLWIEHNKIDDRYYFITYYEPISMNARLRGIIFSVSKDAEVSTYYPKQEWWPIQKWWYSFLIVDS